MSWFCIGTNLFCMAPAFILYNRNFYADAFVTLATGIASFLFHGVELERWTIDLTGIRNTDVILANLLVLHTINTLLHHETRFENTLCMLPVVIYGAETDVFWRFAVLCAYGGGCTVYVLTHRTMFVLRWYLAGLFVILSEIILFTFGNQKDYVWLHGGHHIAAFAAQAAFIKSLR